MPHNVKRRVYRDTEDYVVRLEENQNILFVHIEMKNMSTKVMKELLSEFEVFKKNVAKAGYEYLHSYSATPKFYSMFKGYEDIGGMEWDDKEYRVLRWELK